MNLVRKMLPLLAAIVLMAMPSASAIAGSSCHDIDASGVGQDLGGGHTVAQISNGGLLQGTTEAQFAITGLSGTVASFAGAITFTVNRATLTANVSGTLDIVSGMFSATTTSVSGTGKLAGATGNLVFNGVENLATGAFTEVVSGSICVALAP
jgi:hypothetical protein